MHHTGLPKITLLPFSFNLLSLLFADSRQGKPRNRPSFRQILLHLDIAAADILGAPQETYFKSQVSTITAKHNKLHFVLVTGLYTLVDVYQ